MSSDRVLTPVVFVIDTDAIVRRSLEKLIGHAGLIVETFATAEEFFACKRPNAPSCLILDFELSDIHGLDVQKRVAADEPSVSLIFSTAGADIPAVVQAMKAGAFEFLIKPIQVDGLLSTIHAALEQSRVAYAERAQTERLRRRYAQLTDRQRELMGLVVRGLLNKQVGLELGISEITVKSHRAKVMRRMRADSFADLVNMAARLGVVREPSGRVRRHGANQEWLEQLGG